MRGGVMVEHGPGRGAGASAEVNERELLIGGERQQFRHQHAALGVAPDPVVLPGLPVADADVRFPDGGVGVLTGGSVLVIRHASDRSAARVAGYESLQAVKG